MSFSLYTYANIKDIPTYLIGYIILVGKLPSGGTVRALESPDSCLSWCDNTRYVPLYRHGLNLEVLPIHRYLPGNLRITY